MLFEKSRVRTPCGFMVDKPGWLEPNVLGFNGWSCQPANSQEFRDKKKGAVVDQTTGKVPLTEKPIAWIFQVAKGGR